MNKFDGAKIIGQHGMPFEQELSLDQIYQLLFRKELGLHQYGLNEKIKVLL